MKEGFDKEMDSLLRRRARRAAEPSAGGGRAAGRAAAAAHLDADELGAFAEGALPAGARLAAVSHLADCDECRGAVVALSSVLGGAEIKEQATAVPASGASAKPAGWLARAASLFSPRVLRYAVPALALSFVAVVSFVALRSRQGSPLEVARNERRQAAAPREQAGAGADVSTATSNANVEGLTEQKVDGAAANANANVAAPAPSRGHGAADAPPSAAAEPSVADAAAGSTLPPPPPAPAPVVASEAPAEMSKGGAPKSASVGESESAKAESSRDREKAGRAAEPAEEVASNDLAAQQQRRGAQNRANEVQMPDGSRNQKRSGENTASNIGGAGGGSAAAAPRQENDGAGMRAPARRSRSVVQGERKDDDEAVRVGETRQAAGHRFRREGAAWVDVNYKPSMPSTGVRRGTEAFRALVADVPEVGRVAEQIGGEVVVVVRGRAYRIR